MANIVSSSFTSQVEKDGRKAVHEIHVDLAGTTHDFIYLASNTDNLDTNLAIHALSLGLSLGVSEVNVNIGGVTSQGSLFTPTFVYSTVAENVAALRATYAMASQQQAIMVGDFLNSLTSAQLQSAFGLTAQQVTTLKTNKLAPAATLAASIRAATGQ